MNVTWAIRRTWVIAMLLGCGSASPAGGGAIARDQANTACLAYSACQASDGVNDCLTDVLPGWSADTIRCLSGAGRDCRAANACLGLTIEVDRSCPTGDFCDGNNVIQCADGMKSTLHCGAPGTTGPACVVGVMGRVACGVSTCSGETPSCRGTVAMECDGARFIAKELDCASYGLACAGGACTSAGGGATCPAMLPECSGAAIKYCPGGVETRRDCPSQLVGSSCLAATGPAANPAPIVYCSLGTECVPIKGAESCNGTMITFCGSGLTTTVDCARLGFSRCVAGSTGGHCSP